MGMLKPERIGLADFAEQDISICGKAFVAHMSGALYWPQERALIVADLHLEKGSAFAARGQMLPPYDTRETLQRLARLIDRFQPETVIALGDSLHDVDGAARMDVSDIESLRMLQEDRDWIWITGNHDPKIDRALAGFVISEVTVAGITLRHEPSPGATTHEIAGHFHPAARLVLNGTSLRRPCFVGNGLRLVMPAFGAYTGGLNILDLAFEPVFGAEGMAVWMLGHEGLYPVAPRLLRDD
ncbi:ligase-associated DNA damage response endonuclease PdeM [Hyphomicrobium methylovorum]|uniref:ligase-associated DNA damage response endonuclease PdeM n=1 Tax=Hyphomicrobium methylovorum TaxID=84 RepID=UPI0015E67CC5|nr:ligase-associated DNA damage response endonuclease PdeM [Hyphomicrobium methylovorum]MBA2125524.1 ligase-associated DNA damage response endonuclease PdeM [Hyphomicrobium methylovorum]